MSDTQPALMELVTDIVTGVSYVLVQPELDMPDDGGDDA